MKKPKRPRRAKPAKRKTPKRRTTKKPAAKRRKAAKPARRAKAPRRAKPRKRAVRPSARPAPARAARASAPEPSTGGSHMSALVASALRLQGYGPDPDVVETIAAVGAGYRKGPAGDSPLGLPIDVDAEVAPELVRRYVTGDQAALLDLRVHRPTVRATVDMSIDQLGLGAAGETVRATLTSLTLGSWDPATDEVAKRNAIGGFIVRWYRDGLA
jgi:hypothetical protein